MKKIILILCGLLVTLNLLCQKFSATVNQNQVVVNGQFRVTYTLDAIGSKFRAPSFSNFQVLSGPNQSQNMQYVNGQMSASISISYILRALKKGTFKIPPASIISEGTTINSNPITIKVVKGATNQNNTNKQQSNASSNQIKDNLFIKLLISKRNIFIGEQIVATYKIYTRYNIVDNAINKLPSFNGFYSQDIDLSSQGNLKPEIVNGVQYNATIIKQVILSPQKSGKLVLDPLSMDLIIRVQDNKRARSVFDQFFGGYKDIPFKAISNKATINVKKLPTEGRPSNFNGTVGSFKLSSSIDKQELVTNEAINFKIKLTGKGNIKLIKDPAIDFPPDFEIYDPKESTNIKTTTAGIEGSKTFEYLIIPRHSGVFTIPVFSFSYFDPVQKKYKSIATSPYEITILKGKNDPSVTSDIGKRRVSKKNVALIGSDIRYIKTNAFNLNETNDFYLGSLLFWVLLFSPILLLALLLLVKGKISADQKDVIGLKKRKAEKLARKHLKAAEKHLDENEVSKFYEEIFRSVFGYLANKFNIPIAELNKDRIENELNKTGIDKNVSQELIGILNECEMARYAPNKDLSEKDVFEKVKQLIETIEGGAK